MQASVGTTSRPIARPSIAGPSSIPISSRTPSPATPALSSSQVTAAPASAVSAPRPINTNLEELRAPYRLRLRRRRQDRLPRRLQPHLLPRWCQRAAQRAQWHRHRPNRLQHCQSPLPIAHSRPRLLPQQQPFGFSAAERQPTAAPATPSPAPHPSLPPPQSQGTGYLSSPPPEPRAGNGAAALQLRRPLHFRQQGATEFSFFNFGIQKPDHQAA